MAAEYMASVGIDLDALMANIQSQDEPEQGSDQSSYKIENVASILRVRLPKKPPSSLWDVSMSSGLITEIQPHRQGGPEIRHLPGVIDGQGGLLTPSFCHAHVHLDKCFLLQDEKYSDLEIVEGDFAEAMRITGEAKKRFDHGDLVRRGARLIEESAAAGVTAMRAFVEVDEIVELKCVDAAVTLKHKYRGICDLQICAFAQLALFSGDDGGEQRRRLMCDALARPEVEAIGSTPYVEDDMTKMKQNVAWTISKALESSKFLDYHLDYNVDAHTQPLIWSLVEELKRQNWRENSVRKQICLGHCTRLTLFTEAEWIQLKEIIADLDITFVGLPTSDIFMMGRPDGQSSPGVRVRGTLQIPQMIKDHELNGAISINNVGNAFTPYGSCSPLALASFAVGVYQAGTKQDSEILFQAISERAMRAIGLDSPGLDMQPGREASFLLFNTADHTAGLTSVFGLVHQGWDLYHHYHPRKRNLRVIHRAKEVQSS